MNRFAFLTSVAFIASIISTKVYAEPDSDAVLARRLASVTSLFEAEGGPCKIPKPKLVLDVVPSFGMYDDTNNTLHITTWDKLPPEGHTNYADMVKSRSLDDARAIYEKGTYNWVFTHELGHWWQHCKGKTGADNYSREAGANRIASAYWRTVDPKLMGVFATLFEELERDLPDPVPDGSNKTTYFNHNYDALGHNPPAYIWFQAAMVVDAYKENPTPSLKDALFHPIDFAPIQSGSERHDKFRFR